MMKFRGKLVAALMTGAMAVGMISTVAMATDKITLTKNVNTEDDGTMEPVITFSFSVVPAENASYTENGTTYVVTAGPVGGLEGTEVAFSPADATGAKKTYTHTGDLMTNINRFTAPGVYAYTVTEDDFDYDGMTKDSSKYTVFVTVERDEDTDALSVASVIAVKEGATDKSDLVFNNNYGEGDNDSTHDLTVTKKVTGNQGDKNKDFTFNVTVNGTSGERYTATIDGEYKILDSGVQYNVTTIKHEDKIIIKGLSENDTVTVDEEDYSSDGYTTTGELDGYKVTKDGDEATVENKKDTQTPTGIALNYAPYIMIAALAVVFAFMFLRRRESEEI